MGYIPKSIFLLTNVEYGYNTFPEKMSSNFGNTIYGGLKGRLNCEPRGQGSQLVICHVTLDQVS